MTPQEMIDVIQAYKDGKQIEQKTNVPSSDWIPIEYPSWNFGSITYRIKSKQTKDLYKYLLKNDSNPLYWDSPSFYESLDDIKENYRGYPITIIKRLDHTKITIEE